MDAQEIQRQSDELKQLRDSDPQRLYEMACFYAARAGSRHITEEAIRIGVEYAKEAEAWRARFPAYEYRKQDDCIALKA